MARLSSPLASKALPRATSVAALRGSSRTAWSKLLIAPS
jgi:hypothetical protein